MVENKLVTIDKDKFDKIMIEYKNKFDFSKVEDTSMNGHNKNISNKKDWKPIKAITLELKIYDQM